MKLAVALLLCLLWLPSISYATLPLFMSGFETGDNSEWNIGGNAGSSNTNGTQAIDTSIVNGGAYSWKYSTTASTAPNVYTAVAFTGQTTVYLRYYFRLDAIPASIPFGGLWIGEFDTNSATVANIGLQTDGSGNPSLWLANHQTGSNVQIGSSFAISKNTWYRLEFKAVISATVGVLELKVNGNVVATGSSLNTGTNNIIIYVPEITDASTIGTVTTHIDDFMIKTDAYPGPGGLIARQCNTATPTFNTWSVSAGSNIWQVWDNTPSSSPYAYNSTASAKQTCGLSFNNTTDTGATGHGTGVITATSIINAAQVEWFGANSSADTSQDSSIWYPNGGSETDTLGSLAYHTDGSAVFESTIIATPTAAQVLNLQTGILHTANNNNQHIVYDAWTMIDYSPGLNVAHKSGVMLP